MRWIAGFFETIAGCWQLLRLLFISRFRTKGRYWRWRYETAFGQGEPDKRSEMVKAALDYARWMARTRKVGRSRY